MPRSLEHRRSVRPGRLAAWLIPLAVIAFTGGIIAARVAIRSGDPPQTVAGTPPDTATLTPLPLTDTPTETPTPFVPAPSLRPQTLEGPDLAAAEKATILRVIDGDTFEAELDGDTVRVRFYGIDAPEPTPEDNPERCGPEASQQLAAVLPVGADVLLLPDKRKTDRYDRLLRYIFTPDGNSLDAQMVAAGFAYAWVSDGTYKKQLKKLEEDASLHHRGCLWGS